MTGLVLAIAVVAIATAFGLWWRARDGRVRQSGDEKVQLHAGDLGHMLGDRATFVQFSSAFCAPCRATRATLAAIADVEPGVTHVEVDAENNLDLVRRLNVVRTPTTFVLDGSGIVVRRASGVPRAESVRAILAEI